MSVNVLQTVGEICITWEDGAKVHKAYRPAFDRGEVVELDFAGTKIFVPQFFNAAVGQLLRDYGIDEVRRRLQFVNLPPEGHDPLRRSVENAERYYRDPKYREALDRVLEEQAAEV